MSNQIASFRLHPPLINSTQPAYGNQRPSPAPLQAPTYAVWLNTLWFVSLVFSLASLTVGIIVKQWLKEYSSGLYGNSREIGRRRQYRLKSLEKWHVAEIVAVVPLLLIIAVVLFLAGLVILLYSLHGTVASITSIFVGAMLLFVAATTVLPSLSQSCCYYSAQAYLVFNVFHVFIPALASTPRRLRNASWSSQWWKTLIARIRRLGLLVRHRRFLEGSGSIWKGGERLQATYNSFVARQDLDLSAMLTAYSATLDPTSIYDAITCLTSIFHSWDSWSEYISSLKRIIHPQGKLTSVHPAHNPPFACCFYRLTVYALRNQ